MRKVCIIQARVDSTRLPGKVLKDVAGKPMLSQQLRRLKDCAEIDRMVVATTTRTSDEPIVNLARREGVEWFCGSEEDVLTRYVEAARKNKADVIIRIPGDCPLSDPEVTDRVIRELTENASECDLSSSAGLTSKWKDTAEGKATTPLERTFPRGLDVEAFFWDTLLRIDRLAESQEAREHVTTVARSERPDLFLSRTIVDSQDNSDLRWTVDSEADLLLIRTLYEELSLDVRVAPYPDILAHVRANPHLTRMNDSSETLTG